MEKVRNFPSCLEEIAIGHIIFDHSEWVTLWGFMMQDGRKSRMDFLLTFDKLNKLLRLSGAAGDKIQMLLVDRMEQGTEDPSCLDMAEHFGGPVHLDGCRLQVSPTGIQDAEGCWHADPSCLSIDEVTPLVETATPVLSVRAATQRNMDQCAEVLIKLYELYLGYLEIGFDEESALEKAELKDDLKFKMAYYSWQMKNAA